MKCPECPCEESVVLYTRPSDYGPRRRRECTSCGHRWSTVEIPWDRFVDYRRARGRKPPTGKRFVVPENWREEYKRLTRTKRIPAAQAKQMIKDQLKK